MQLYFSDHFGTSLYSLGLIVVSEKNQKYPDTKTDNFLKNAHILETTISKVHVQ